MPTYKEIKSHNKYRGSQLSRRNPSDKRLEQVCGWHKEEAAPLSYTDVTFALAHYIELAEHLQEELDRLRAIEDAYNDLVEVINSEADCFHQAYGQHSATGRRLQNMLKGKVTTESIP